ncbi:DNA polymerase III subunit delta [Parasphingorhabdus sp. JC815]|uniref:DNA polymerase III subunit delta n=1 Tax=Parasphingorhabdus sp. JC815 TaxID=3232140 RepID=UPI00345A3894
MKVKDNEIVRRFHAAPDSFKLAVLCGPNATRCQALANELAAPLAGNAERVDLTIADLSESAARLNDEATSASLFGDKRYIMVHLNSGEAVRAAASIENLLESQTSGDPVFIVAAGMADKTALAKKIAKAPDALIATCYETSQGDAVTAISGMARDEGLRISRDMSAAIAALTSNDLVLAKLEIEKLVLYLDATPDNPREAEADLLSVLGAENDEEDLGLLINAAMSGDIRKLTSELASAMIIGFSEVGLIRLMLRHLSKLAELRAKVDQGGNIGKLVNHPSIFWKDRDNFARQLGLWPAAHIARLIERILSLEIALKSSGQPERVLVEQELLTIARKAAQAKKSVGQKSAGMR